MIQQRAGVGRILATAAVVSALVAITVVLIFRVLGSGRPQLAAPSSATAYERVVSSGTIRAGYVSYPPASVIDPASKSISGVFPDVLREVGRATSLKVEFTQETSYADMIQGLNSGKFDIVGGVWANPNRGKMVTISAPVYYTGVGVWVRPSEARFNGNNNWTSLNSSKVRIAAIDGSTPLNIAKEQFPRAALKTYPAGTPESQLFLDLVQNKVDVFFAEPAQGLRYLSSNPRSIKDISGGKPLRLFASVFLMPTADVQMKTLIDTALDELQSSGKLDAIIAQYEPQPGVFLRRALPYRTPSEDSAASATTK